MTQITITMNESLAKAVMALLRSEIEFDQESYDENIDSLITDIKNQLGEAKYVCLVDMPQHDKIQSDGNTDTLDTLVTFVDYLQDTHDVSIKSGEPLWTRAEFAELAFKYFGYDYAAWIGEKDTLLEFIRSSD